MARLSKPKGQDLERLAREKLEAELAKHTFKPAINPDTDLILDMAQYKPIHERVGDVQRARNENLQRMRVEAEVGNPELTFQPRINPDSERLAEQDPAFHHDVTRRMAQQAADAQRRLVEKQLAWEAEQAAKHSYHPEVSSGSRRMLEGTTDTFFDRQRRTADARRRRMQDAVHSDEKECTFQPQVTGADAALSRLRPSRLGETDEERVERLATRDKTRVEQARTAMEEQYYAQFTFKPRINSLSRVLGRAHTVEEHVSNESAKESRQRIQRELDRKHEAECTFKPQLRKSGVEAKAPLQLSKARDPEDVSRRVEEYIQARAKKLAQSRRELEYKELEGCTFEPDTARPAVEAPDGPVVVRGLGRFLEGKQLARKLEEEQREREAKAFLVRGATKAVPGPPTVCQPFSLSVDPRAERRRQRLVDEQRERQLKECTFHPRTSEGANRALLQQLLHDEAAEEAERVRRRRGSAALEAW